MELVLNNKTDIICLQESWLRKCDGYILEKIKEHNFEYYIERKPRKIDIGGGILILHKKNVPLKRIKYKQYPSFEAITVVFNRIAITNIYWDF